MKRLIACAVLAVILAAVCVFSIMTSSKSVKRLSDVLEKSIEYSDAGNASGAVDAIAEFTELWEKDKSMIVMYADRSCIDDVDEQLAYITELCNRESDEFAVQVRVCEFLVGRIYENEKITAKSIF